MKAGSAKENILNRIAKALETPVPEPFLELEAGKDIFIHSDEDLAVAFAEEFTKLGGRFKVCTDEMDLIVELRKLVVAKGWSKLFCVEEKLKAAVDAVVAAPYPELATCDASVTGCEYLVSRTGSIALSSALPLGRTASAYAPVHICVAYHHQLVYDIRDAIEGIREKYNGDVPSFITFATGPSRTADIEKTLVTGVHGPKEVYLFLIAK